MKQFKIFFRILISAIVVLALAAPAVSAKEPQSLTLTRDEYEYVKNRGVIKAASLDGTAPIQYRDSDGSIKGISIDVLEKVSAMTGLSFEYELFSTIEESLQSDADIVFGVLEKDSLPNIDHSIPYLSADLIMFMNTSVDPDELDGKKYAAIKGTSLPEGIKEENTVYFNTREECLDAVESGKADYGYGNAYSVAYYMVRNNYRNIITVPRQMDQRKYCIAFIKDDDMLLSIINKAISSIDETSLSIFILNAATRVDRKITVPMIFHVYGLQLHIITILIITVLVFSIILNVRSKNEIKHQYERYQLLSQTSNEFLYEYHVKSKQLDLSKSCEELFGGADNFDDLKNAFNLALKNRENTIPVIELTVSDGSRRLFKSVNSFLYDDHGKVDSVIGKLIDINEEETVRKELIKKSETDGLTGLYNAVTTRTLIAERIKSGAADDAMLLMDCDKFKYINDTYGHLQGDKVLINIGKALARSFRKTDIIGRMGGDEFCVYMSDIPSRDFVLSRCRRLMDTVTELNTDVAVTVSIGVAMYDGEASYDELFRKADKALYAAKGKGRNQIEFYV